MNPIDALKSKSIIISFLAGISIGFPAAYYVYNTSSQEIRENNIDYSRKNLDLRKENDDLLEKLKNSIPIDQFNALKDKLNNEISKNNLALIELDKINKNNFILNTPKSYTFDIFSKTIWCPWGNDKPCFSIEDFINSPNHMSDKKIENGYTLKIKTLASSTGRFEFSNDDNRIPFWLGNKNYTISSYVNLKNNKITLKIEKNSEN